MRNSVPSIVAVVLVGAAIVFTSLALTLVLVQVASGAEIKEARFEIESHYNMRDPFLLEYTVGERPQLPSQQGEQEVWSYSIRLINEFSLLNTRLGETLWYNKITGASTTSQFRYVGYEYRFTQQFTPGVGLFYHHHSEHGIDVGRDQYPLQDSFGISVCFLGPKC